MKNKIENPFKVLFWGVPLIIVLWCAILVFAPKFAYLYWIGVEDKGVIGDFINGVTAPFITLIGIIVTFLAFFIQFQANIQQRQQFIDALELQKNQFDNSKNIDERKWLLERFDEKFYELLKLHKENILDLNIQQLVRGRECFEHLFYELKFINSIVDKELQELSTNVECRTARIAYEIFFWGVSIGPKTPFANKLTVSEKEIYFKALVKLNEVANTIVKCKNYPCSITKSDSGVEIKREELFYYLPFRGHSDILGHYFRHLYLCSKYVTEESNLLNDDEKIAYIRMLRAQLSNFEQLLLYYNATSWFDKKWKDVFTKYKLIRNLPLSLADFKPLPEEHFRQEILEMWKKNKEVMFDWHNENGPPIYKD